MGTLCGSMILRRFKTPLPLAFPAKNTWLPRLALAIFHYSSWCCLGIGKSWKIRYLRIWYIRLVVSNILFLTPIPGEFDPIWRAYFSKGLVQPPTTVKPYNKKLSQSCQTLANFLLGKVPLRNFFQGPDSQSTFLNPNVLIVVADGQPPEKPLAQNPNYAAGRIFCLCPAHTLQAIPSPQKRSREARSCVARSPERH